MTSKISFLASITANAKRRIGLFIIMALYFIMAYPFSTAIVLSNESMAYTFRDLPYHLGITFGREVLGFGFGNCFMSGVLGIGAALQGFVYMYSKKKLDFYMSVPVKKEKHFWTIYANGLIAYLFFFGLNLALAFPVAKVCGATMTAYAFREAFWGFILNSAVYFASYNLGILAVMLTGNLVVAMAASAVFMLYDAVTIMIIIICNSTFFESYYYKTSDEIQRFSVTPVTRGFQLLGSAIEMNYLTGLRTLDVSALSQGLACILAFGLVILGIAYYSYGKKPSEACGKCLAFPKMRGIIKVFLLIPASIGFGMICYSMSGSSKPFLAIGALVGLLIGHFVIEVIYEFDIRIFKNGWKSFGVAAVLVVGVLSVYLADLTGYDRFVPNPDDVDSYVVMFQDEYRVFYETTDSNPLQDTDSETYVFDHMALADANPICEIAKKRMGLKPFQDPEEHKFRTAVVYYRMKNGEGIYRTFPIDIAEDAKEMDAIYALPTYKESLSLAYDQAVLDHLAKMDLTYSNGFGSAQLASDKKDAFINAYREDYMNMTFSQRAKTVMIGQTELKLISKSRYFVENLPIYDCFEKTKAFLKSEGLFREKFLYPNEVKKITITNYHYEMYDDQEEYNNFDVETTITDPSEISEVIEGLYPMDFSYDWNGAANVDNNYNVTVYPYGSSDDADMEYFMNGYNYSFVKDKIPSYVVERTAYTE